MTHSSSDTHSQLKRIALVVLALVVAACEPAKPLYVPKDPVLRRAPVYLYPADETPARAAVVFFGNDVGFWDAHDRLAQRLAGAGYTVIGIDVKKLIDAMPDDAAVRAATFDSEVTPLIERAARELHVDTLPLVIGGHSFGADLALWMAAHDPPPRTAGVLALGPTLRSHFYVTAVDRANVSEPTEPGSFAVAEEIAHVRPTLPIALMRGANDHRRGIDSVLVAAGGPRLKYSVIPLASHSLKSLTIAAPMVESSLAWILRR